MAEDKVIRISARAHDWLRERQHRIALQRKEAGNPKPWLSIGDVVDALIERVIEWESGESA